ncbi:MAG: efflux RND transporter permease subunit [Pirellulales bacterium]
MIRIRWLLLAVAAGLAAVAWPLSDQLAFDRSIEKMFAPDDPLLEPYRKLKVIYGGNEVVMAAFIVDQASSAADGAADQPDQPDSSLTADAARAKLAELTNEIRGTPGVRSVLSLTTVPNNPPLYDLLEGYAVSADRQTGAVVAILEPDIDDEQKAAAIDAMRAAVQSRYDPGVVAGEPVMVVEGFRMVEDDGHRLRIWSLLLVSLTVLLLFRSIRWLLIPLAVVQLTLILTEAALVVSRLDLSMVSSMLAAIVTVVGVATVIHIIVRFRESRTLGLPAREALSRAMTLLAVPIVLACLTDAVGFSSLLIARVGPIQDFGIMMAIGSLLVIVSTFLLVPPLALCFGRFDADPRLAWGEGSLDRALRGIADVAMQRPKSVGLLAVLIAAGSIYGIRFTEVETDFTKNFRADSEIVQSYELIESRLGGAGVWDVMIPLPEEAAAEIDKEFIAKLKNYQRRLYREVTIVGADGQPEPGLTKVLSLSDGLDAMPFQGIARLLSVERRVAGLDKISPGIVPMLRGDSPDGRHYVRVMLRARERQSSENKRQIIEQVRAITAEEFPAAEVTGFYVLLTHLIDSMIQDQWRTFGAATAGIALMMLIAFRSFRLAAIAMVPNVVPILILLGWLGWLGIKINMGAAMIAAVSIGLSIDSSIHYLWSYRRARKEGATVSDAIHATHQSVGRAMFFSTLALIVGFASLCASEFIPTIYFGALVSLAMLGGLLGNLVILPLMLGWGHKD